MLISSDSSDSEAFRELELSTKRPKKVSEAGLSSSVPYTSRVTRARARKEN